MVATMTGNSIDLREDRLALRSRLSDMARLPVWIESLAARHDIPANVQFAIDLCLEEALSNVIRHGYAGAEDRPVTVQFTMAGERYFKFVIEDEAPRFNPLEAPELPAMSDGDDAGSAARVFAFCATLRTRSSMSRQHTGNRLIIGFSGEKASGSPDA